MRSLLHHLVVNSPRRSHSLAVRRIQTLSLIDSADCFASTPYKTIAVIMIIQIALGIVLGGLILKHLDAVLRLGFFTLRLVLVAAEIGAGYFAYKYYGGIGIAAFVLCIFLLMFITSFIEDQLYEIKSIGRPQYLNNKVAPAQHLKKNKPSVIAIVLIFIFILLIYFTNHIAIFHQQA